MVMKIMIIFLQLKDKINVTIIKAIKCIQSENDLQTNRIIF